MANNDFMDNVPQYKWNIDFQPQVDYKQETWFKEIENAYNDTQEDY